MNKILVMEKQQAEHVHSSSWLRIKTWFKRGISGAFILFITLASSGFIYETVMEMGDAQRYPAPGQLVMVDGHQMHIRCVGQGSPTVIMESGAGGFSMMWSAALVTAISQSTRVCAYDRAGYGWSEARPEARNAWQIADELHGLLTTANIQPPYIMVGASNGGLYVRSYAAEYVDEVAGLVLIDATSEAEVDQIKSFPSVIFMVMGRLGIFRLFPDMICPGSACNPQVKGMIAAFRGRPTVYQTLDREWGALQAPDNLAELRERLSRAGNLGSIPLVILSANQSGLPEDHWPADYGDHMNNYRKLMTSLSSNNRYVLVNGGHGIDVEQPEIVIQSVKDVIESIRSTKTLVK